MNTYYLSALDAQFKYECKVINLSYEYPGYTGKEKWAIITDLTEKELIEKYDEIISSYRPFCEQANRSVLTVSMNISMRTVTVSVIPYIVGNS